MATAQQLSAVWPTASRLTGAGRLEIGGCDAVALAREFGTPAYVVAEDDLRARARAFLAAFRVHAPDAELLFAAKAFPCVAVLRVFAEEGLGCDVASGGELHLALRAGHDPSRIVLHGNAKSEAELQTAVDAGVRYVVVDNLDELDRLERVAAGRTQRVLLRVTPDVAGDTHAKISTGQADSKFGLNPGDARMAIARLERSAALRLDGYHLHIGSQLLELEPFRRAIHALAELGDVDVLDLGGGLGVTYGPQDAPPSVEAYAELKVRAVAEAFGPGKRILDEPGRALVATAGVTLYTVQSVKRNVATHVAVDGGMSDNLRPMLYGARYEAQVADRFGGGTSCRLVGKHCESGDVLIEAADLADPRPGDVVVVPATGAYGHALANTYNGVPRPPVVFAAGGDARLVVRRETLDELTARDVPA